MSGKRFIEWNHQHMKLLAALILDDQPGIWGLCSLDFLLQYLMGAACAKRKAGQDLVPGLSVLTQRLY